MYYVGIDPGSKGAICLLDPSRAYTPWFIDLKTDSREVYALLSMNLDIAKCAVEDVHSIYGMSAKSNFQFGAQVGRIHTLLECLDIPFELVQPKEWQKVTGIPARKTLPEGVTLKQAVADRAQELFPDSELHGPRGGLLDGRADALMIAYYLIVRGNNDLQAHYEGTAKVVPETGARKRSRSPKV